MITARRTRLLRVADLHAFRQVIVTVARSPDHFGREAESDPHPRPEHAPHIVVPSRGAARQLRALLGGTPSKLVTRDQLYDALHERLPNRLARLGEIERDAIAQASAAEAARQIPALSFRLRPGLVAEMLRFYDQLRRQSQEVDRFEELMTAVVGGPSGSEDRGAERLLQQTRFLARAFREYERRIAESTAHDEHSLRQRLIAEAAPDPVRHVIVTVADWIADAGGLYGADFDLLARIPGLERLDLVCTEATLGSGFDERLHNWWPGLADVEATTTAPRVRPRLVTAAEPEQPWFTYRDREDELLAIARRIPDGAALGRHAVVYKHPLPYLYLAPETFGACGVPYEASDALPLAAEPTSAALDLVLELAETNFARGAIVALLRSPHFRFRGGPDPSNGLPDDDVAISRAAVSALDAALSDARHLGDFGNLERLAAEWARVERRQAALDALHAALRVCRELAPLAAPAPASRQLRLVLSFLDKHLRPLAEGDRLAPRERRGRAAVTALLTSLAGAHEAHHDARWTIDDLASAIRRWVAGETFDPDTGGGGVRFLDDQAARYGLFDHLAIVGLVDQDWPDRPRPSIFYPSRMLRSLGWPSEKDRRGAADARFIDLLASASGTVTVSTFSLDEDAVVMRSTQLDEIPRAGLTTVPATDQAVREFPFEALAADRAAPDALDGASREWLASRRSRPAPDAPQFHGFVGSRPRDSWSVSALETYLACPFKFFALHVLRLGEEPEDEEVMDPRRQGALVHRVFEAFFTRWQASGHGAIAPGNLPDARAMFERVVDEALHGLSEAEAGLERTRLLGSAAATGLGEAVFRMEAERPVAVVERLLEHPLAGRFTVATSAGPRVVSIRGKADRLDLLEDGTFRLIDYKLGWPPNRARALQLPIYAICAEQRLSVERGRSWTLGEAAYLAFKGPKRVVPLFSTPADREKSLADAQERLAQTIDAIERGDFPPTPDDVYRCDTCSAAAVCRKDYVGDVRT